MPFLQDIIHQLEVGSGWRFLRISIAVLVILLLFAGYDWRGYKNMNCQEAMDAAQVGRNLAQGKGFSTLFVRPFSMYLLKRRNTAQASVGLSASADAYDIKGMHPDLANPPVYPLVLAGLMKVLPFNYTVNTNSAFWTGPPSHPGGPPMFMRYEPDFLIALFNQLLLLAAVVTTFFLARRLFDTRVAWLSAILLLGSELLWRFSVSGLSTILLILVFVGVAWCLALLEAEARKPEGTPRRLLVLAGMTGVAVGVGGLTRYAFVWLIVPVLLFVLLFSGKQRVMAALVALFTFAAVMTPWVVRNYNLSGTPFGTAGYSVLENTMLFPEHRLERSLEPDLSRVYLQPIWTKLITNTRQILQTDMLKLGGGWISALFLTGLLVGFHTPAVRRMRYFLLGSLVVLVLAQALGRTQLSEDSPEINSENLLVLLAPLVLVYGVSLFFLLLDQIEPPFLELRYAVVALFSVVVCLPLLFAFLPPKTNPVAYPPYYPPMVQTAGRWLNPDELSMSDVPWAMAWYGQRQSVWLTLNCVSDPKDHTNQENFFAINDNLKPISLLYLTPVTMDARFVTGWIRAGELSWGQFILDSLVKKKVPEKFPLSESPAGWFPEQMVLTDWPRWRRH